MCSPQNATRHEWGSSPEFVGPRHALRERLLLALLLSGSPGRRILNIGAGQGSFTRSLEERGYEVVSADVSAAAVAVLERRVRGEVLLADLVDLPFPDAAFDAVVAGEVLEHIERESDALLEAARVLCAGGLLALSVPAHPGWFGASDRWAGHVRRYTRATLSRALSDGGFVLERIQPWGFPVSAFYHRAIYDKRAPTLATDGREHRVAKSVLRAALTIDRLFVGVERGCLGYLALAHVRPALRATG
jgi:ubiquinone/menaquinone biosynthesis C-methylase UbiE